MVRDSKTVFGIFGILVFCMAVCPIASAVMMHSGQSAGHCHEQKPEDSGKQNDSGPKCCDQQGIVKSDSDPVAVHAVAIIPQIFIASLLEQQDRFLPLEYRPQKTGERLASLSVLRI